MMKALTGPWKQRLAVHMLLLEEKLELRRSQALLVP